MAKPRPSFEVHLDDAELGVSCQVGTLYRHDTRTDLPGSFAYEPTWLESDARFMLDPRLELWTGEQHPPHGEEAFGIFMDSAPDRWGRVLMERREAVLAHREGRPIRHLQEMDFLLGVNDETRTGALRFRKPGGPFLADAPLAAPPTTSLPELAAIARRIEEPGVELLPEYEQWLAMLVAPGTSLGGARPKANYRSADGLLWIAKFPAKDDRHDVGGWEFVIHRLARAAGIEVPASELLRLADFSTFCVQRFDRTGNGRRMYASAMTLLERTDGDASVSYLDLAEFISTRGAAGHVEADLEQLYRRVTFNVLTANRDDHLRNHGFLLTKSGWRLAPAFDMNPAPAKAEHTLKLDDRTGLPGLDVVAKTAPFYRLDAAKSKRIFEEIRATLAQWKTLARNAGLANVEIERMAGVIAPSGKEFLP